MLDILHGQDPTLLDDIQTLWDTLKAELGRPALLDWLALEYPWLEKPTTTPIRAWWVLQNKYDQTFGLCPVCRASCAPGRATCAGCEV